MADLAINYPPLPPLPPLPQSGAYTTSARPIPPILWRIYNDSSVSRRLLDGGFLAGSPERTIDMNSPGDVGVEIKLHLNWYCPARTVLISSSQNFRWVQYHALKRELKGRLNVRVAQINTALALEYGAQLFHMMALAEFSGSEIPQRAANSAKDEWVFLRQIPSWSVVADYSAREFMTLQQFQNGDLFVTPQVQYPTLNGWGSSLLVNQSYNMGYGLSWQYTNINPSFWYLGNNYTWQSPAGPSIFQPLTTSPNWSGNGYPPASAGRTVTGGILFTEGEGEPADTVVDDQGPVDMLPALAPRSISGARCSAVATLPTTMSAGSYISYPTLPEIASKTATTPNLGRAAVQYWESIYGADHEDYWDNGSETGYGTGDERFGLEYEGSYYEEQDWSEFEER